MIDGILQDTFHQKASMAWHPASTSRLVVSLLLPGSLEAEERLIFTKRKRHMWSTQMTSHTIAANLPTEQFMQRERRRLKARHIWEKLHLDWPKLRKRLLTKHATGLSWKELYDRLFLNIYTGQVKYKENKYNGPDVDRVQAHWDRTALLPHFQKLDYLDAAAWGWIAQQERTIARLWMCGTILWEANKEACGVVGYAMERSASLWCTIGGIPGDSARWTYYMGIYL